MECERCGIKIDGGRLCGPCWTYIYANNDVGKEDGRMEPIKLTKTDYGQGWADGHKAAQEGGRMDEKRVELICEQLNNEEGKMNRTITQMDSLARQLSKLQELLRRLGLKENGESIDMKFSFLALPGTQNGLDFYIDLPLDVVVDVLVPAFEQITQQLAERAAILLSVCEKNSYPEKQQAIEK